MGICKHSIGNTKMPILFLVLISCQFCFYMVGTAASRTYTNGSVCVVCCWANYQKLYSLKKYILVWCEVISTSSSLDCGIHMINI